MPHSPAGRIDCHVHYMASAFVYHMTRHVAGQDVLRSVAASRPAWRDLAVHRELMDRANVDVSIILPHGTDLLEVLRGAGGPIHETTAAYNRSMSDDVALTNGRFLAAAVVDPFGGRDEVAQLDRSLSLPGMVAVGLLAGYDGIALNDPLFEPMFEVARHHDVPVMVHPSSFPRSWIEMLRLDNQFLRTGLGFFLDDALCILRMATGGTFDKFPDVRFMFCQLGGLAPLCCGRWEYHRRQAHILHRERGASLPAWANTPLSDYLSHVWLDAHTQDRHALALVMGEAGAHVIVLGGDHPYTPPEDGIPYTMAELAALGLSDEVKRQIERENALNLLGPRARSLLPA